MADEWIVDKHLSNETVEGEIGLVIDYVPGESSALEVLGGAMALIQSLDSLDRALLSTVDTELEPVSVLNDVRHSSLKILLARVLRKVPDQHLTGLEWKKWVGGLLVKGKHILLQKLDADTPEIERKLRELDADYKAAPQLLGYEPPKVSSVRTALRDVSKARNTLKGHSVIFQSELGDIFLGAGIAGDQEVIDAGVDATVTNKIREFLKVRYPDMLGQAQWTVVRGGRYTRVEILHQAWLDNYHARLFTILPGDSLDCSFEETIEYDAERNEVDRKISIIEVHGVITPPQQHQL